MIRPFALAVLSVMIICGSVGADQQKPSVIKPVCQDSALDGYQLVWHDEFNANALDTSVWDYRIGPRLESYNQASNVSVHDGCLDIVVRKETAGGKPYTSGGIKTKKAFGYGYYEARYKCPASPGWHSSFWTTAVGTAEIPKAQEIDICEQDSAKPTTYSAGVIDWSAGPKNYGRKGFTISDARQNFHVWGCEFTPDVVSFYLDGKMTHSTPISGFPHVPANIVWLTSVGAFWGTKAFDDNTLPAHAYFDWVRFYQKAAPSP
jgi:beta-glucanase (GH16 family)